METALKSESAQMKEAEVHAAANRIYHAAVYVRLSKEDIASDGGTGREESDSIVNQRELIRAFLADKPDIEICEEYAEM